MERDLSLLGATAVEDKLQDGVKETLVSLGQAGISVWMITGDKKETATNISYSCGHFRPDMTVLELTEQSVGQPWRRLSAWQTRQPLIIAEAAHKEFLYQSVGAGKNLNYYCVLLVTFDLLLL